MVCGRSVLKGITKGRCMSLVADGASGRISSFRVCGQVALLKAAVIVQ